MNKHLLSLKTNQSGRDFVVGDIHGMFTALDDLLKKADFNKDSDRLISVGDLIDRGNESERVLEYLEKPWFYSIMGNHELMCIESENDEHTYRNWVKHNGGEWWPAVPTDKQQEIRKALSVLPTIAEIETRQGKIGVVHADISARTNWSGFAEKIGKDKTLRQFASWSRGHYDRYKAIGDTENIPGVKYVLVGHTPVSKPLDIGNIRYIDTGAPYTDNKSLGTLTMMQIQPDIKIYQTNTRKKRRWVFA